MQHFGEQYTTSVVHLLAACFLIAGIGGCDFLERDTSARLNPSAFYQTRNDLEAGVAAAWSPVTRGRYRSFASPTIVIPLMGGDDWTTEPSRRAPATIDRYEALPTNKFLARNWNKSYRAFYRANTLLENLDSSPVQQEAKDQAAAQVRFLRGWLYFRLVRFFGPVPLKTTTEIDLSAGRAPVDSVYAQIVGDLTFAEENLPDSWSGAPAKPTSLAATALLGRVHLTMAGWPLKDEGHYAQARDKFRTVMNSGSFSLLEDFSALWQIENNWNDEIVFGLALCQECNRPNMLTGSTTAPLEEGGTGVGLAEVQFFNNFPQGERKEATFHTTFNDGTDWQDGTLSHPHFAKWRSGTSLAGDGPNNPQSSRTIPIIRYAHVLLGFAEAQAMAEGGASTEAYAAINAVRNRAGLPDLTSGLGQMAFRDSVIAERGWEFAGEFTRWHDLVRTEKVAEANTNEAPQDMDPLRDIKSIPKKNFYWLPIPQSEVDQAQNITQNPGY